MAEPKKRDFAYERQAREAEREPHLRSALKALVLLRAAGSAAQAVPPLTAVEAGALLAHMWDLKHRVAALQRSRASIRGKANKAREALAAVLKAERVVHRELRVVERTFHSFDGVSTRKLKAEDKREPA